jgi:hypothetical protein
MSNTIEIVDSVVTSEFLRLLKKSDSITVKIDQAAKTTRVTLTKKLHDKDFNQAVDVRIEAGPFHGYISVMGDAKYNFATFHTFGLQHDGDFDALKALLRVGDRMEFNAIDLKNGYMDHAQIPSESWDNNDRGTHPDYYGLHSDTLRVTIFRKDKPIVSLMSLITNNVPKNSCRCLQIH